MPGLLLMYTEQIECDLEVVGVTAIEDKLQDDAATTIADIGKAGELYASILCCRSVCSYNLDQSNHRRSRSLFDRFYIGNYV